MRLTNIFTSRATLAAPHCGYCGKTKSFGKAFCNNCFYALPYDLRTFLYRPLGDGFEGAYATALEWLTDKYGETNASKS